MDEKELPEWYHMAKGFFREINCYSNSMYEDMNGHAILNQIRYAAERESAQQKRAADLLKASEIPQPEVVKVVIALPAESG